MSRTRCLLGGYHYLYRLRGMSLGQFWLHGHLHSLYISSRESFGVLLALPLDCQLCHCSRHRAWRWDRQSDECHTDYIFCQRWYNQRAMVSDILLDDVRDTAGYWFTLCIPGGILVVGIIAHLLIIDNPQNLGTASSDNSDDTTTLLPSETQI